MAFLTQAELEKIGFASLGKDVQISDKASLYNPARISIGDHSRVDDFCVLSAGGGGIVIGSHVHIACYSSLIGKMTITLEDFAGLSSRVCIYSSSDDYSGESLTNPTTPDRFRNVQHAPVKLGRHVIVGAGTVILPGVTIGEGAAVGALSLLMKNIDPFTIVMGSPPRKVGQRSMKLLELEQEMLQEKTREKP